MRYIVATFLLVSLAACGEASAVYNCKCNVMCDGNTATAEETACATSDEAQEAVNDAVAECQENLSDCEQYECKCTCTPTETEC